ncbi:MAG: VOC family protein [Chthonomonadales bacterium]
MSINNAIASLAVKDLKSAVQWYEKLLGRQADSGHNPDVAEWKFEGGGGLQVYQSDERPGKGSVTFDVSSIEDQIADLEKCGIDPGRRITTETMKVVMIKDPDSNSIAFAESISTLP